MKHFPVNCLVGCAICAALLVLSSCANDAYDKGEGDYSLMQAEMAEIHINSNVLVDYFITDANDRYSVATPFKNSWMTTPDSTYRAVAYFNKRDDGMADVIGLSRVGVLMPKRLKNLKTDPVRFESVWISPNRAYLNAGIYLLMGSTDDEQSIHTLGCHIDTLHRNDDGTETMQLTLHHDQGGVPEYYSQRTYVSIPLKDAMTDSVCITIHTYDGIVRKTFKR